ncbi:MAG: hypothetical protein JSV44_00970 [Candidatus Zixiibacteriota bacterium]|nr:MAG: hypothetical protein JSV44_00970 [candidate division Zixibacteria bacterium]
MIDTVWIGGRTFGGTDSPRRSGRAREGTIFGNLSIIPGKIVSREKGQFMSISSCPEDIVVDTAACSGKTVRTGGSAHRLEIENIENWCAGNGCRFTMRYTVYREE